MAVTFVLRHLLAGARACDRNDTLRQERSKLPQYSRIPFEHAPPPP